MPQPDQTGDVRVNRANLLRRIGRVCFQTHGLPALPAPKGVDFINHQLWLYFDTFEDAALWAERYRLKAEFDKVVRGERSGQWFGDFDGELVTVRGSSPVTVEEPADTDPDDLSEALPPIRSDETIGRPEDVGRMCREGTCGHDHASIEDAPPRGTDAAEAHEAKPDDVAGYGHERGTNGFTEEPDAALTFKATAVEGGAIRRWEVRGPAGSVTFEIAEAAGMVSPAAYVWPPEGSDGDGDALSGKLARQLHKAFVAEGEPAVREQLEHWYGEFLAGGA